MVEQPGSRTAIVSSKELRTNCWSSFRFIRDMRCPRVFTCKYPEKKTCRAVEAEIAYLQQLTKEIKKNAKASIQQLKNDLKK